MVGALGLSSGVRRQKGRLGWICIIWLISTLDVTVGEYIMQTKHWVSATCGDNVTLPCEVAPVDPDSLIGLYWIKNNTTFCAGESHSTNEFLCHNTSEGTRHSINLTIMNIMPANEGAYSCKMRSTKGPADRQTIVKLERCIEESHHRVSESDVECTFSGVYPSGSKVIWFLGDTKLTNATNTQNKEADGRFTVTSKVKKHKGITNELYNCLLFVPFNSIQSMTFVKEQVFSGSGVIKLTWICMLVEMVLLILGFQFLYDGI